MGSDTREGVVWLGWQRNNENTITGIVPKLATISIII